MSATISNKQMEKQLYDLVSCLADNYGFDADEAFEFSRWETDVDHVGEILKAVEKPDSKKAVKKAEPVDESVASAVADDSDKIATCQKNIELWKKKLADGKVKDSDKQREKIEKEESKLAKLLEKAPKVDEKPEPVPVAVAAPVKEKRIKRFSPVMASQLKTALADVKIDMTDKLKKEFQQYVEDLTDDDFRKEGFADHMRTFAKMQIPVSAPAVEDSSDDESVTMKATGGVVDVTLVELQSIDMTATIDPPGTFWDADNGRFVKGPEADDDEDFEEVTFEKTKYVVGEKTGRVYEARDTGDIFAGFIGVGKFKKMTK
jgi:hypothetical protein